MCSEFWNGWFDDWGGHHHVTPVATPPRDLDELLRLGASVNIYMFHGGTNFGLTNGANDKGTYRPITTSYDYDAPLDEAGNPTAKYWAFRDVLAKYTTVPRGSPGCRRRPAPSFAVAAPPGASRSGTVARPARRVGRPRRPRHAPTSSATTRASRCTGRPSTSTRAGRARRSARSATAPRSSSTGSRVGVLARDHHDRRLSLPSGARGTLDLLVEDQGRVDYGPRIGEPKGLIGAGHRRRRPAARLGGAAAAARRHHAGRRGAARPQPAGAGRPCGWPAPPSPARSSTCQARATCTSAPTGWGKGVAWINGFCLGRYWSRGPQRTLYVPGPVTRKDGNELIILELGATTSGTLRFVPGPDLGHTET